MNTKKILKLLKDLQRKLKNLSIPFEYQYEFNKILLKNIKEKNPKLKDLFFNNEFIPVILTVKYPNITIRNSENQSKYLGDIYALFSVKFRLDVNIEEQMYSIDLVHIVRSEYNYRDLYTNEKIKPGSSLYTHSHISSTIESFYLDDLNKFDTLKETKCTIGKICLGSSILAHKTKFVGLNEIPQIIFYYKKFFEWESLEGYPYNRFSTKEQFLENSYRPITLSSLLLNYINKNNIKDFINDTTIDLDIIIHNVTYLNVINLALNKEQLKKIIKDLKITNINLIRPNVPIDVEMYHYTVEIDNCLNFKNELINCSYFDQIVQSFENLGLFFKNKKVYPILKMDDDEDLKDEKNLDKTSKLVELIINKYGNGERLIVSIPVNEKFEIKLFIANLINKLIKTKNSYV